MGRTCSILFWVLVTSGSVGVASAQGVKPSPATLAVKPQKVDVESPKISQPLGEKAEYDIVLKDAYNKPAKADHDTGIVISCFDASGSLVQQAQVQISKGDSKTTSACDTKQAGPLRVEAKQKDNELLGGKAVIFVTQPQPPKPQVVPPPAQQKPPEKPGALLFRPGVRFLEVAQVHEVAPVVVPFRLSLLPGETDALVNGSSQVQFQVCFTQGAPQHPQTLVLYTHDGSSSNSELAIPANQPCGSATLTSHTPGQVTVRIASAAVGRLGTAAIDPPNQITLTFHKIIADFRLDEPRSTMSLIESADLVARFYDEQNRVTSVGEDRVVTFSLTGAGLFQPQPVRVAASGTEARTTLYPTYWGQARVSASTNTLAQTTQKIIVVRVLQVLLIAIVGGAIGAMISYAQFRDILFWRVIVGTVTGLFLVWMATWALVTALSPAMVHNVESGFFLALAGGYAGLPVIDWFLKLIRLGGLRPEPGH